ncbi:MAG: DUF935 family protein [Agrobacterium cavarae]
MHRASVDLAAVDAIDTSVTQILSDDGWEPMIAPVIAGLETEISMATSLDEVREILTRRFERMDMATMTDMLARATFSARLAGLNDDALSDEVK